MTLGGVGRVMVLVVIFSPLMALGIVIHAHLRDRDRIGTNFEASIADVGIGKRFRNLCTAPGTDIVVPVAMPKK